MPSIILENDTFLSSTSIKKYLHNLYPTIITKDYYLNILTSIKIIKSSVMEIRNLILKIYNGYSCTIENKAINLLQIIRQRTTISRS